MLCLWVMMIPILWSILLGPALHLVTEGPGGAAVIWVALPVQHYLSNVASFVIYGITCPIIRLIEFAALFATIEESVCYAQVALDKWFPLK